MTVLVVAISGASGTGKTTISRALYSLLTSASPPVAPHVKVRLLHQDDFYLPEAQLPVKRVPRHAESTNEQEEQEVEEETVVNWDSPQSLDMAQLRIVLSDYRHRSDGLFSSDIERDLHSRAKEDRNTISDTVAITDAVLDAASARLRLALAHRSDLHGVLIVDGFMLHHHSSATLSQTDATLRRPDLAELFDCRILLRAAGSSVELCKRRENRSYATLEGTWSDPPGYWDHVIWPEYVAHHAYLFQDGDVDGVPLPESDTGVVVQDTKHDGLDASFDLVVNTLLKQLRQA